MNLSGSWAAGALSLAIGLFCVAASHGGQPTPADESFSETVDVNVVNVDVVAYDRKGRPLSGLGIDDFEIFEDGRPVEITNFYEETRVAWARSAPQIVVYLDDTSLSTSARDAVLATLRDFVLERVARDGARVMVADSDDFLNVHQGFTDEAGSIVKAFDHLVAEPATTSVGRAFERNMRSDMEQLFELLRGGPNEKRVARTAMNGLLASAAGFAEAVRRDALRSTASLELLLRALAAQPGRKDLYLVADGIAVRPLAELVTSFHSFLSSPEGTHFSLSSDASHGIRMGTPSTLAGDDPDGNEEAESIGIELPSSENSVVAQDIDTSLARLEQRLSRLSTLEELTALAANANSSRVSVYSIRPPTRDASRSGLGNDAGDSERALSNLREAHELLAEATAGQSMVAGRDVEAFLERTASPTARYSLAFASRAAPGPHRLEVRSKKADRLLHREGYITRSAEQQFLARTTATLTGGWIDNPHRISMQIVSTQRRADGSYDVSIALSLPVEVVKLRETFGSFSADCVAAVMTREADQPLGTKGQLLEIPVRMTYEEHRAAEEGEFVIRIPLHLPAGRQRVAVGLWEKDAARSSFVREDFEIGEGLE